MVTNPFQAYGIKEVADVILYETKTGKPVLFFDSLKVSNIEQTAEMAEARGGKGNPKLISWDYGKEITITLQDALLSMKSLELLMGGTVNNFDTTTKKIKKAEIVTLDSSKAFVPKFTPADLTSGVYVLEGATVATSTTSPTGGYIYSAGSSGDIVRVVYEVNTLTTGTGVYEIVITPNKFPGTYLLVGDTVVRNAKTGLDEGFQFIIPKAKIGSETTFTMEAEGDPSVFDITLTVLKADNGSMMSLVKYDIGSGAAGAAISNLT